MLSPIEMRCLCSLVEEWMNMKFSQHSFINPLHIPETVKVLLFRVKNEYLSALSTGLPDTVHS